MPPPGFVLRRATLIDVPALTPLIGASARELSKGDYTAAQVEGALRSAFGIDTQLIRDGSYFVIESEGRFAGCGGWSRRRTLFGSDARADRDASELDPLIDAAKIRAFFVHPDFARRGLGTLLLDRCEQDAMAYGFTRFELMGTLPGVRLYAVRGYVAAPQIEWPLGDGVHIQFVPMHKDAGAGPYDIAHCSPADAPAILELQTLAHESEARLYDDRTLPPLTQTLDDLRLELESATVLKALNTGRLVGSVRAREQDGTVHVGRLIVLPELQGRGLGTLLMRRIEACFPEAKRFELFTGNRSEASLRLYERLGYRRSREQMLSSSIALVFMEKQR